MGGKSKTQTVGYRYRMGLHMGICHGPVDALLEIRCGDRAAWNGQRYGPPVYDIYRPKSPPIYPIIEVSPVTENEALFIYAPKLFGGDKREGGVQGDLDVMMGEDDQPTNAYLTGQQGTPQPAYRGMLGVVYRGLITSNNPYVKPWAFKVRRVLKGWRGGAPWYAEKAEISMASGAVVAMNAAHIVYECLTNTEWGMGEPAGRLDDASFRAAADVFHAEGMGLCLQLVRQDSIENFVQIAINHAGAVLVEDRRTGLFKLKAIRGGYEVGDLPAFGDQLGNVVRLEQFDRTGYTGTVNELTVVYTDATTGKDGSVTVQNLAAVQAQGAVEPETRQYPGLPTMELATRVAMRDLRGSSSGLARARLVLTRDAYSIEPGDVIAFSWGPLGIADMPLRVVAVNYGTLTNGEVRVEAVEDIYGLPATTYITPQPPGWEEPDTQPQASPAALAFEAPYRDLVQNIGRADAQALPAETGYLGLVAARPAGFSLDYTLLSRVVAGEWDERGTGPWAPTGLLVSAISPTATAISLTNAADFGQVFAGTAAIIGTGPGAEVVRIESTDTNTNSATIARGCLDTVPKSWPVGTRVWFYDDFLGGDSTEYVDGESIEAKPVTRSSAGELDPALAPTATVTMDSRAARPYPPGRLRINAAAYSSALVVDPITATWAHRDRLLQDDQLVDSEQASIGPEPGTTYTVRTYLDNVLVNTEAGIAGTSSSPFSPAAAGSVRVEVAAVRDGLESWQAASWTFPWTPPTNVRITDNNDTRITDSGDRRVRD